MKVLDTIHCWRVEATMPAGHPLGHKQWKINKKIVVACSTAERAIDMAREYFVSPVTVWSVNHHIGQESTILLDEESASDDKS